MIANPDWAATAGPDPKECCHNVKLIGPEPTTPDDTLYALAYDFDSSGLVDAKYAVPAEGLGIRSVTQRVYRGYCAHNESLEKARQKMLKNEQAIYGLVKEESRLEPGKQDKALRFLGAFFDILRNDKAFEKGIKLVRTAQNYLSQAEQRIASLTEDDGNFVTKDFNENEK